VSSLPAAATGPVVAVVAAMKDPNPVVLAIIALLCAVAAAAGAGKNWQVSIPVPGTGSNGGIPASIVQRGYVDCYHTLATNTWNCRKPGGSYVDVTP
jgi:hypothetical protein